MLCSQDLVTDPDQFFRLLSKHQIGYTFLPNFFLAAAVKAFNGRQDKVALDFSKLRVIMCGGEANKTATISSAEHILKQFGAAPHCVKAAYGLSEVRKYRMI
jgi:acyl-coenzyme A synthetase/AMP-(fatty) acid ligase